MAVEEIGGSLGSLKGDDPDGLNLVRHNSVTALRAHGLGEDRFGFLFLDCELACHIDPSTTLPLVRVRTMRRWGGSPIARATSNWWHAVPLAIHVGVMALGTTALDTARACTL